MIADLAHEWARRAVLEIARKTGRLTAPQPAFQDGRDPHSAASNMDAIARIEAATQLRDAAWRLIVGYARFARGAGHPWEEVGAALGSKHLADPGSDAAGAGFDHVAETAAFGWPAFSHVCHVCRRTIIERGPRHPSNGEDGHAETCPRLAVAAARTGEQT